MRMTEVLSRCLDGVAQVVAAAPDGVDLRRGLSLPDGVGYGEDTGDGRLGRDSLLLGFVGPEASRFAVGPLSRLDIGARALVLLGWPAEELPYQRLVEPLIEHRCQVVSVFPVDPPAPAGVFCALVVERVEKLAGPRRGSGPADAEAPADDLAAMLRVANEFALSDFVARRLRERVAELTERVQAQEEQLAERDDRLHETRRKLSSTRSRLEMLESSASFQLGRTLVQAVRHPATAVATVPRDLVRIWRSKKARNAPPQQPAPAVVDRVVPIALPGDPDGSPRGVMTLTAPAKLLVPGRLAEVGLAGYEPEALACFLAAMDVARPGAVLDIGANIGIYAALASAVTKREVCAFEPTPSLAAICRRFATDNELQFVTEALALGAENGTATFYLSDRSDTSNSLAAGFRHSSHQVMVPVETLDSYVERTGLVPAVMKVDTETTEPDVLAGGMRTITEHRPWILCEVLAGRVEDRLTEVFTRLGYRHWYRVTEHIPYEAETKIVGDRTYTNLMWLFTPEPPGDDFWAALRARTAALSACTPDRVSSCKSP